MSKRKGPSQPQPYAVRMAAAKTVISDQQRQAIVHRCLTTIYQASVIALNEQFGFGPERITRFRDAMEQTVNEYGNLLAGADVDYADTALERRYKQIMGEEKGQ